MATRRHLLLRTMALGAGALVLPLRLGRAADVARFEIEMSEDAWRQRLTPQQFQILRQHGTERPGSSPLNGENRSGVYQCAGCEQAVFSSTAKYDSGTGWPSFSSPIEGAVGTREDRSLWMALTEVHCGRCGGHLGHVFEDGPPPTGLRYCINGAALIFRPA